MSETNDVQTVLLVTKGQSPIKAPFCTMIFIYAQLHDMTASVYKIAWHKNTRWSSGQLA